MILMMLNTLQNRPPSIVSLNNSVKNLRGAQAKLWKKIHNLSSWKNNNEQSLFREKNDQELLITQRKDMLDKCIHSMLSFLYWQTYAVCRGREICRGSSQQEPGVTAGSWARLCNIKWLWGKWGSHYQNSTTSTVRPKQTWKQTW